MSCGAPHVISQAGRNKGKAKLMKDELRNKHGYEDAQAGTAMRPLLLEPRCINLGYCICKVRTLL
jgi:hypothetical protein